MQNYVGSRNKISSLAEMASMWGEELARCFKLPFSVSHDREHEEIEMELRRLKILRREQEGMIHV
jgi:hypothetical protein